MCIKKCKTCGWEHPPSYVGRKCTICGELLDLLTCYKCGKVKPVEEFEKERNICKECRAIRFVEARKRHNIMLADRYANWLEKVKNVPNDYPTLTEAQWLEACSFFDGCARCGSKDIDSRGMFIGAKSGGRYCDWNIIPLCEKCSSTWDLNINVFKYTEKRAYNLKKLEYMANLEKIVDYLWRKLDNATNSATGENERTAE